jgi:hypothetical protein
MGRFTARDNESMRKRITAPAPPPTEVADRPEWLDLRRLAEVEVTSEADGYPVESVFSFGAGPGWRAGWPGEQTIRLIFTKPQAIHRIRLQFTEPRVARSQEFSIRWAGGPGEPLKEAVRQQWNFSPDGSTAEMEDYRIELPGVSILELTIDPDRGAGYAIATLDDWRIG